MKIFFCMGTATSASGGCRENSRHGSSDSDERMFGLPKRIVPGPIWRSSLLKLTHTAEKTGSEKIHNADSTSSPIRAEKFRGERKNVRNIETDACKLAS